MTHVVVMEKRLADWGMHVPAIDLCLPVNSPADAPLFAARLLSTATGAAVGPDQVEVLLSDRSQILFPATPVEVGIRHHDGAWYPGRHVGWLRQPNRSWRALVCYLVAGVQWERAVPAGSLSMGAERRQPGSRDQGTAPH